MDYKKELKKLRKDIEKRFSEVIDSITSLGDGAEAEKLKRTIKKSSKKITKKVKKALKQAHPLAIGNKRKMVNVEVAPKGSKWVVQYEGLIKAPRPYATQQQAIEIATEEAKLLGAELLIKGKDGKIRERNSYGKDPHPPKG